MLTVDPECLLHIASKALAQLEQPENCPLSLHHAFPSSAISGGNFEPIMVRTSYNLRWV